MDKERMKSNLKRVGKWSCLICSILIIAPIVVFIAIGISGTIIAHIYGLTVNQVSGVYECNNYYGVRARLVVYPNKTFEQSASVPGKPVLRSSGRWHIDKEYLRFDELLNPESKTRFVPGLFAGAGVDLQGCAARQVECLPGGVKIGIGTGPISGGIDFGEGFACGSIGIPYLGWGIGGMMCACFGDILYSRELGSR